jgi:hypothetical protein
VGNYRRQTFVAGMARRNENVSFPASEKGKSVPRRLENQGVNFLHLSMFTTCTSRMSAKNAPTTCVGRSPRVWIGRNG